MRSESNVGSRAFRGARGRAVGAFAAEGISSFQSFVILFSALHYLSVVEIGEFTLSYTGAFLIKVVLKSLLLTPLSVHFSAADRGCQREAGSQALGACLVIGMISLALLAGTSLAVQGQTRTMVLATGLVLPALIVQETWRVFFFTIGRPWQAVINDAACLAATLLLVGLVVIQRGTASPALLLMLWSAGTGIGAVLGVAQARMWPAISHTWGWVRRYAALGIRIAAANSVIQISGRLSLTLIAGIAGVADLGRLAASRTLVSPATTVATSTMSFGLREAAQLHLRGDRRLTWFIPGLSMFLVSTVLVLGLGIFLIPESTGRLLAGENWHVAKDLLIPVVLWAAATALRQGPNIGLLVFVQPSAILQLSMATGSAVLIASSIGALVGGAAGAAWALAGVQVAAAVPWWISYLRHARIERQHDDYA